MMYMYRMTGMQKTAGGRGAENADRREEQRQIGTEVRNMFEYRMEKYAVRDAEEKMNRMAADGWRVIAVCPNQAGSFGIIVTYERQR